MKRKKFTTYMNPNLILAIRKDALDEKQSVASILEKLVLDYLESKGIHVVLEAEPLN